MLVKFCSKKKEEWSTYLDSCVFAYNTSCHESTGITPFQLMFNRRSTLPIDINTRKSSSEEEVAKYFQCEDPDHVQVEEKWMKQLEEAKKNILAAQKKQKKAYDKKHANPELFETNQLVLKKDIRRKRRRGGKLEQRYIGPFVVSGVVSRGVYRLTSQDGKTVVKAIGAHLKAYKKPNPESECPMVSSFT